MTVDLVTGAFGYTGSYIAERLLERGRLVRTLTRRSGEGHPLGSRVEAIPLRIEDGESLAAAFEGVDTFYNTYWRRFGRPGVGFDDMVEQSSRLIEAAAAAGVRRMVQFSVSNASDEAPTAYFRAKARVEQIALASGISTVVLRPTLLFGPGDILVNNLAWTLRRVPIFGIPGRGDYLVQPVLVADVADLAIGLAVAGDIGTVDAAGPETYRFADLVRLLRNRIRAPARLIPVPPWFALLAARAAGRIVGDVVLTRDEVTELMGGLLVSGGPPTCPTAFSAWLDTNAHRVGRRYASEVQRNYRLSGNTTEPDQLR
jgi:NADH dehydrogenase